MGRTIELLMSPAISSSAKIFNNKGGRICMKNDLLMFLFTGVEEILQGTNANAMETGMFDDIIKKLRIVSRRLSCFILLLVLLIVIIKYLIKNFWELPRIVEKHKEDKMIIKLLIAIIVCVICFSLGAIC